MRKINELWNDMVLITIIWVLFFSCFSGFIIIYMVRKTISLFLLGSTISSLIALIYCYKVFIDDYKKVEKEK
jgi:hypothetical protein